MDNLNIREMIRAFHEGGLTHAYQLFGAHIEESGTVFRVYAPHAERISVIGDFNGWNREQNVMEQIDDSGIWEVLIAGVKEGDAYEYAVTCADGHLEKKADPYAFYSQKRPAHASRVYEPGTIRWQDKHWMNHRTKNFDSVMSIYEVYAGGWKKNKEEVLSYTELADQLIPYVKDHGYTHIEMMPLNEHPFDGSWGYQASGYFSCTSRYGTPNEFASFVNTCHRNGIGVIMDMVPVHFVRDDFGLRYFDGEPLYEYPQEHDAQSQWGTMNFNLWSEEVRSFLISAAMFWCDVYHVDGLRMDAISNVIYWGGDSNRGINDGGLNFIKRLNRCMNQEYPSVMLIAEDSSAFPYVTNFAIDGGLGFDYKWDLGWMNDTLQYYSKDPIYRKWEHNKINFSMFYYYNERYILPLSHDENVHGKHTVIGRMWGNYEQQFAQVRNLYAYMYGHPGKKLNFMGNELAVFREFDEARELDWNLLEYPAHVAFHRYIKDLNLLYQSYSCLYRGEYNRDSFRWIDADDAERSTFSFCRLGRSEVIVCIYNMTPLLHEQFHVRVPYEGIYTEILNSEKGIYNGCDLCNEEPVTAIQILSPAAAGSKHKKAEKSYEIVIRSAPFSAIWMHCTKQDKKKNKQSGTVNRASE